MGCLDGNFHVFPFACSLGKKWVVTCDKPPIGSPLVKFEGYTVQRSIHVYVIYIFSHMNFPFVRKRKRGKIDVLFNSEEEAISLGIPTNLESFFQLPFRKLVQQGKVVYW
uniref:cytochrome b6/f complex subunit VIII n=1 Tax=Coniogramme japonica TaxID=29598 RepID=UPI00257B0EBB|nr:cytochrome b6/f complex subunit VIII [Coniogramme japonica]WHE42719.1 cytochrome b6/f complex subunit VIII [Coniogramme japonica]